MNYATYSEFSLNSNNTRPHILALDKFKPKIIITNCVFAGVVFCVVSYLIFNFIRSLCRGSFKKRNLNFLLFYISFQLLLIFRVLYSLSAQNLIYFNETLYGVWTCFPSMLAITSALFFVDTMIFSLLDAKGQLHLRQYNWTRLIPFTMLLVTWIIGVMIFIGVIHQNYHGSSFNWYNTYYYFSASLTWMTCLIMIFLTSKFVRVLHQFEHVYKQKRGMLYTILIVMIIQLAARMVHLILAALILNKWETKSEETGDPSPFIYYGFYFIICDVLPSLVFNWYLNLEINDREQVFKEESTLFLIALWPPQAKNGLAKAPRVNQKSLRIDSELFFLK